MIDERGASATCYGAAFHGAHPKRAMPRGKVRIWSKADMRCRLAQNGPQRY
jgi:hypothetical protein